MAVVERCWSAVHGVVYPIIACSRPVHEAVERARPELHLPQPAVAGGRAVDQRRVGRQRVVDRDDLAIGGRIDVGCGLYRFDHDGGVALLEALPDLGKLDEDEVAELLLRMVRDADDGDAVLEPDPFMVFGEVGLGHADHPLR